VNNKQADLNQRAAAITDWGPVVEKLSSALKQQAEAARAEAAARTLEKLRSRQTRLPVRMADSEFNRVWNGQCSDEVASEPVVSGPDLREMVALLESSHQRVFSCYPNDRKGPSPKSLASSITGSVISKALACDWL
jgi:hypothetical protein